MMDACLERVAKAILAQGGEFLITADHGNCELVADPITASPAHDELGADLVGDARRARPDTARRWARGRGVDGARADGSCGAREITGGRCCAAPDLSLTSSDVVRSARQEWRARPHCSFIDFAE
jgi:hypothetical protein